MRFTYVHFPKAGGTSLHKQLEVSFSNRILYDYAHDPLVNPVPREPADEHVANGYSGICGHFHPLRYSSIPTDLFFTILREPVENLISIYYFWKDFPRLGNPVHDRFLDESPSLEDFAQHFPLKNLMSDVYFGSFDMGRFDFIGFYDRRKQSFETIAHFLGIEIDSSYHINKTSEKYLAMRNQISDNKKLVGCLKDALINDVRFYERMRFKYLK